MNFKLANKIYSFHHLKMHEHIKLPFRIDTSATAMKDIDLPLKSPLKAKHLQPENFNHVAVSPTVRTNAPTPPNTPIKATCPQLPSPAGDVESENINNLLPVPETGTLRASTYPVTRYPQNTPLSPRAGNVQKRQKLAVTIDETKRRPVDPMRLMSALDNVCTD